MEELYMKLKTRILAMLAIVALVVSSMGVVAFAADDDVKIRSLSFTKKRTTMTNGTDYEFEVTIRPDDYTDDGSIEWSSSDEGVLEVENSGDTSCLVTAVGPGTATITAKSEARTSVKVSISVTVPGSTSSSSSSSSSSSDERDTDSKTSTSSTAAVSSSKPAASSSSPDMGGGGTAQAVTMPRETLVSAVSTAGGKTLYYSGYNVVSAETLQAAASAGKSSVAFDTKVGNTVTGRVTVTPSLASNLSGSLMLSVYSTGKQIDSVQAVYNKYFSNTTKAIRCDQENYIMNVRIAVKLGTMNSNNLYFYTYNLSSNRYAPLTVSDVKVDNNGYIHFTTNKGGYIIISDGPLAAK